MPIGDCGDALFASPFGRARKTSPVLGDPWGGQPPPGGRTPAHFSIRNHATDQSLEHDLGGRVLERTSAGVRPTSGGHALAEKAKGLVADYDSTMAEARRLVRGEGERLRIGYVASAVQEYLGPALGALRRAYPKGKVKMLDQTPGEMIIALRRGEIDLALTHHGADLLSRDFYTHKLASVPSLVALPLDHPLASRKQISISELKNESFVGGPDSIVPAYHQKI